LWSIGLAPKPPKNILEGCDFESELNHSKEQFAVFRALLDSGKKRSRREWITTREA
jgi:hypothetical protein